MWMQARRAPPRVLVRGSSSSCCCHPASRRRARPTPPRLRLAATLQPPGSASSSSAGAPGRSCSGEDASVAGGGPLPVVDYASAASEILLLCGWEEGIEADLDDIVARASQGEAMSPPPSPTAAASVSQEADEVAAAAARKQRLCRAFCNLSPTWRLILLSDGSVTRHVRALSMGDVQVHTFNVDTFKVERVRLAGTHDAADAPEEKDAERRPDERAPHTDEDARSRASGGPALGSSRPSPRRAVPADVLAMLQASSKGTVLQRETWLSVENRRLVYAVSWWDEATYQRYMKEESRTIWENLRDCKAELYREIRTIYRGQNPELSRAFELPEEHSGNDASADASSYLWGRHYVFQHENRPLAVIYEAFSPAFEEWLVSGGRGARTR